MIGRALKQEEIPEIWKIDRSEEITNVYHWVEGKLTLLPEVYHMQGWPPGEEEKYTPLLVECFQHGGWFYGLFGENALVGVAILENEWIGEQRDLLQLKFLHVSSGYRGRGLGKQLFALAKETARRRGASGIYISATPSEHTIQFYFQQGCVISQHHDAALFALEPEDIHLECRW